MISVTEWQRALRATDLPLATKGVLFTLATYADWKTGEHARPGKRLQDDCHISRTQAWEHIKRGIAAGLLEITYHGGAGSGNNSANEYRLVVPEHVRDSERAYTDHVRDSDEHVRDSEQAHVRDSEHHLDIEPSHNHLVDIDEPPSGEDRAKDSTGPTLTRVERIRLEIDRLLDDYVDEYAKAMPWGLDWDLDRARLDAARAIRGIVSDYGTNKARDRIKANIAFWAEQRERTAS